MFNFWQMADTGPCGPTAEIHWDWDPSQGTEAIAAELEHSSGRMLELWNLVFMQYNQNADGSREPLPSPGVDTGLGLERIVSVLQGKRINYQTDLFTPIIARIQQLNGASDTQREADPVPYNVIADHMRAASFLKGWLGLPFEVTRVVAQEQGYSVDEAAFKAAEETHGLASGGGQAMGEINQNEVYSAVVKQLKDSGALPAAGVAYDPYSG